LKKKVVKRITNSLLKNNLRYYVAFIGYTLSAYGDRNLVCSCLPMEDYW